MMLVVGYKAGADFNKATAAVSKHLGISLHEAKNICDKIEKGETVKIENDFVLREDLEDCKFFIV